MFNIKSFIVLTVIFLPLFIFSQNAKENEQKEIEEGYILFPKCEGLSKERFYTCNSDQLGKFISNHIVYPVEALNKELEGKVLVRYIITSEGRVNFFVNKEKTSGDSILLQVAVNIVGNLKDSINQGNLKVIPSKIAGKNADSYYTLPLQFKLFKKEDINKFYQKKIIIATYRTIEKTVQFRKDTEGNIYAYLLLPDKSEKLLITLSNQENSANFTEEELSYLFLYNLTFSKSEILLTTGTLNNKEYEIFIDKGVNNDYLQASSSEIRINIYSPALYNKPVDTLFNFEQLFNSPYAALLFK